MTMLPPLCHFLSKRPPAERLTPTYGVSFDTTNARLLMLFKLPLQAGHLSMQVGVLFAASCPLLLQLCDMGIQLPLLQLKLGQVLHEVVMVVLDVDQLQPHTSYFNPLLQCRGAGMLDMQLQSAAEYEHDCASRGDDQGTQY